MSDQWAELRAAAGDVCRANCRRHRERGILRLRRALEALRGSGAAPGSEDAREALLGRLVAYAEEYQEDPEAAVLVEEARRLGVRG